LHRPAIHHFLGIKTVILLTGLKSIKIKEANPDASHKPYIFGINFGRQPVGLRPKRQGKHK
jgi:hypothetical protein